MATIWVVWRSCGSPWSLFLLTVKVKEATFAVILMTADSQLIMRDVEIFCDSFSILPALYPKKRKRKKKKRISLTRNR